MSRLALLLSGLLAASACSTSRVSSPPVARALVSVEGIYCYILQPVHFRQGSATLETDHGELVDELARTMKQHPDAFVLVELSGFASTDEPNASELSHRRAIAVRDALVARGVHPARLRAKGYGATCSIRETPEDAALKDQRVEARILRNKDGDTGATLECSEAADAGSKT